MPDKFHFSFDCFSLRTFLPSSALCLLRYFQLMALSLLLPVVLFAENIVFDNFSHQVTLVKKHPYYQIMGTRQKVSLSNRLIVKTLSSITREDLYQYHPQVIRVTELFSGTQNHYYSLELKEQKALAQVLSDLKGQKGIQLVQPDILQLHNKAEMPLPGDLHSPYIDLLNIRALWQQSKGRGVKIAIIDDGFNFQHPDLQHISPIFSYDVETKKLSSLPVSHLDLHGTKVLGIIFAAHNSIGLNGIAPEAELIALRQPDTWTSNTLLSFQLAKLAGATIINCSWHSNWLLQPVAEAVNELATLGRDGKGIAVVFSAGNFGQIIKEGSSEAAIKSAIVVGANGPDFRPLSYSNYGASVDMFAYGKSVQTTLASGQYGLFSGTSLAAAIVSGLSALLLSQQPDLTLEQLLLELKILTQTNSEYNLKRLIYQTDKGINNFDSTNNRKK